MNQELFLPPGYVENPPLSRDNASTPYWSREQSWLELTWQVPVYVFVASELRRRPGSCVVDVGCGTAYKAVKYLSPHAALLVGLDQSSGVRAAPADNGLYRWIEADLDRPPSYDDLELPSSPVAVCADVIEHLPDPMPLLHFFGEITESGGTVYLSTPDRDVLAGSGSIGPPTNPRHIREWTMREFDRLLEHAGLNVRSKRHLAPRSYEFGIGEFLRAIKRLGTGRSLALPWSCMLYELRNGTDSLSTAN